jgi:hypothetical protein
MKSFKLPALKRIALLAIPSFALIAYVGYGQYDSRQTKQKFANIEQGIDSLKAELEKQGINDISKNKYCLRDGEKFGGGQLRCSVILSSTIPIGFKDVEPLMKNIEKALLDSNFQKNGEIDKQEKIIFVPYSHNKSYCRLLLTSENIEKTQLEFYCIDDVNQPIYPVIE